MANNKLSDFDHWKQTSKQSLFINRQTNKLYYAKPDRYDKNDDEWLGYAMTYQISDKGNKKSGADCWGRGGAIDFFGKGIVFRLWGLKDENYLFMAALIQNKWRVFSTKDYVFHFVLKLDNAELLIRAVKVIIECFDILENRSQTVECEIIIPK